jgi:hypothetical protein
VSIIANRPEASDRRWRTTPADIFARRCRLVGRSVLACDFLPNTIQFAFGQRVDQVFGEYRPGTVSCGKAVAGKPVGALVHRSLHLSAEPAVRDSCAALDQPAIKPGRTRRFDLRSKVKIGTVGEDQAATTPRLSGQWRAARRYRQWPVLAPAPRSRRSGRDAPRPSVPSITA